MKISRITWLILGVGILAIAAAGLYMLYQDQLEEQDNLNQSISVAQAALPGLISEKGGLEDQLAQLEDELAQAEAGLTQAEAGFPASVQSIFYGDLLFSLAGSLDLEVISLTATEPAEMTEEDINYGVTYFTVVIKGEVANVLQYITNIEVDDEFKTAGIETVSTAIPLPLTEQEKEELREAATEEKIEGLIMEALAGLPEQEELTEEDLEAMIEELREVVEELRELTREEAAALTVGDIEGLITEAMLGVTEEITPEDIFQVVGKLEELIELLNEFKGLVEAEIAASVAEEIDKLEMPSTTINLRVLSYES